MLRVAPLMPAAGYVVAPYIAPGLHATEASLSKTTSQTIARLLVSKPSPCTHVPLSSLDKRTPAIPSTTPIGTPHHRQTTPSFPARARAASTPSQCPQPKSKIVTLCHCVSLFFPAQQGLRHHLLMVSAFRCDSICPDKTVDDPLMTCGDLVLDTQTYVGGHVEALQFLC